MKPLETLSLCPICKKRIPARYEQQGDDIVFTKHCSEHGDFSCIVWQGEGFDHWNCCWKPEYDLNDSCPDNCGLCDEHKNRTCCTILDITNRCNLNCDFCFANGGKGTDVPKEKLFAALDDIISHGNRYLHISGGEPTVHSDCIDIIAYAKKIGFEYIQLNTNGIRIAEDPDYAKSLCEAGTSCVFLQFDGTNDDIYKRIRGKELLDLKLKAIENCDKAELGVVLVPTLIPGINTDNIGDIISFAVNKMPAVRGIHFQPVAYTGRYHAGEHFIMSSLLDAIEKETNQLIKKSDLSPSSCDAPMCGFHAEFTKKGDTLIHKSGNAAACCCGAASVIQNQKFVKQRWTRVRSTDKKDSFDSVIKDISDTSFCISAMLFMDLDSLDLGRCRQCTISVYKNGKYIPFCIYNNYYNRASDQ